MSRFLAWDVRDHLVTIAGSVAGARVFPQARPRTGDVPRLFVTVGSDGGDTGAEPSDEGIVWQQEPAQQGPGTWFRESGSVVCAFWRWSGSTDLARIETDARAAADAFLTALQADKHLNGLLIDGEAVATAGRARTRQQPSGAHVRIAVTVSYRGLVT